MQQCIQGMADGSVAQLSLTAELHDRRARIAVAQTPRDGEVSVSDGAESSSPVGTKPSEAVQHLHAALTARKQLVRASQGDFQDAQADARAQAASTALRIAGMHCAEQQLQEARQVCADTLAACSGEAALTLELARLELCLGDAQACERLVRCFAHAAPRTLLTHAVPCTSNLESLTA
jgi:hypothetical protein